MKACVIAEASRLSIEEMSPPTPDPSGVVVKLRAGGICGSDLHYYHSGRVGEFIIREPMILGHEVSGEIIAAGTEVTRFAIGDRVAVNPARYCGVCRECRTGRSNLCPNVLFFGSAARFPHVQGIFSEEFKAQEAQCVPVSNGLSFAAAACAEPLAVALHAVNRAGSLLAKRILISGAGPIGLLTLLAARLAGAVEITITDQVNEPLEVARSLGAANTINIMQNPEELERLVRDGGQVDVAFEAAGAYSALITCLTSVRPGGRVVQLGSLPSRGSEDLRLTRVVTREIDLIGTFRFYEEYEQAVKFLERGMIDPTPLLTAQIPLAEAARAFELASDRTKSLKVSLVC